MHLAICNGFRRQAYCFSPSVLDFDASLLFTCMLRYFFFYDQQGPNLLGWSAVAMVGYHTLFLCKTELRGLK
jgi:hypothetical protein